ncbi:MAG TPA: Crp/Fnr family transcriptional regulator [Deltaproteobacteria bacterium]|nr:Crp/Fnr family transcriptional regulator [Deltaproteobacteria bacterium]
MEAFEILSHIPLFKGLPDDQLRILAGCASERRYRPGEAIFIQEDEAQALYLVIWGRVKIFKASEDGREQTIFMFGPGEPFCLTALADEFSPASAMALDEVRIFSFSAKVLESVARKEPSLLFNMLLVLSRRLKESLSLIEALALKDIPQRLSAYLAAVLVQQGAGEVIELGFSQRELAKVLGTTPETLSRVFRKLETEGVLEVRNRSIRVIDADALLKSSGKDDPDNPRADRRGR